MRIPISEFKSDLSHYLAQARAGAVLEITSHGKPVARVVGISPTHDASGVGRLLARGAAQWSGGKPEFEAPVSLEPGGSSLSDMISEDRG